MNQPQKTNLSQLVKEILGYLNFSSGSRDVRFFSSLNSLFELTVEPNHFIGPAALSSASSFASEPSFQLDPNSHVYKVLTVLQQGLVDLSKQSDAFRIGDQADLILQLVKDELLPSYLRFHSDLLFHQRHDLIFNSLFLGKVFESVLREGGPWTETDRIVKHAISELNDYIGYRPIPVLEGEEKHQPYEHEWIAPVPLYMAEVGVAVGRYQDVVQQALAILKETDPQILYEACFNLDRLQELVLDPRAYDFDHPVNRKPNYHFGLWDPHFIDKDGFYSRFVVHQVTIDGILSRIETAYSGESDDADIPIDELIYEAGSVLVGTMLMGAGVCGETPSTFDSETSLGTLMPMIAAYRDRFYEQLLDKIPEKMQPRILAEQERLFQPFGGCRQSLNKQLAKRRANQLQRMHLSRIFARMGYFAAASFQSDIIAVVSARIMTKIDCLITQAHLLIDRHQFEEAATHLPEIESLIRRGIACGAMVDPWTILGFGANYSLFHTAENTIHDHRVDDLINLLEDLFDLFSRLQKEAAASGHSELQAELSDKMSDLAGWWDQYGSTEVSGLESFSGSDAWESAAKVSTALAAWHHAGTAAGDIAFWNRHVERFNSTKAYVLLAEALLEQRDPVASMALMMHWLSNSDNIPLTEGDYSFHSIAMRWMEQLWRSPESDAEEDLLATPERPKSFPPMSLIERWNMTKKFFDFTEANADRYWSVPELRLSEDMFEHDHSTRQKGKSFDEEMPNDLDINEDIPDENFLQNEISDGESDENADSLYSAAYENVVYHDTTDDGIDDSMMEAKSPDAFNSEDDDFELVKETERISERLTFIVTMSKLWKFVAEKIATVQFGASDEDRPIAPPLDTDEVSQNLDAWLNQIVFYSEGLDALLRKAATYRVPPPRATTDSLLEYDRHRGTKEILLDRIIWTQVDVSDAKMLLESFLGKEHWRNVTENWEKEVLLVNHRVWMGDLKEVKKRWPGMLEVLSHETILYVPTSRGGAPWAIVRCRCIQQAIMRLMEYAPRLGLINESFRILSTIQAMEENNTISQGAITEFDRLVETATRAITQCVAISSRKWEPKKNERNWVSADFALVEYMERIIELLLESWLSHSRQIRISPIESIVERSYWDEIKQFIKRYGKDIFTQQHMGFGNLRAVLHQGMDNFLHALVRMKEDEGEVEMAATLIDDLQKGAIEWEEAVSRLEIIFESIAENYTEYVDYNSTTTHSDHGEKLYMLLDMLRVQVGYDRISWNLKPVYWVHDALIRAGCDEAALLWERAVARRSVNAAEQHLQQYTRLSEKYGMWLPSVHERLQERFVRPLQVDRMCGLVPKAIRQAREDGPTPAFEELYDQVENFAKEPMGVGFEMPEWLTSLQDEVMATRVDNNGGKEKDLFGFTPHFDQVCIPRTQLDKIITTLTKKGRYA